MKKFSMQWGGIAGAIGGLMWAIFMVALATDTKRSLFQAMQAPPIGLLLSMIIAFFALGFLGIAFHSRAVSLVRIIAIICAAIAAAQSLAVFVATVVGFKPAYFLGIVSEPALALGLLALGASSLTCPLPAGIKVIPFLMALVYIPSFVLDPAALPPGIARSFPDLLAALYGILWTMLGLITYRSSRRSRKIP